MCIVDRLVEVARTVVQHTAAGMRGIVALPGRHWIGDFDIDHLDGPASTPCSAPPGRDG